MASISTSVPIVRFQSHSLQPVIYNFKPHIFATGLEFKAEVRFTSTYSNWVSPKRRRDLVFRVRCSSGNLDENDSKDEVQKEKDIVESGNPDENDSKDEVQKEKDIVESGNPVERVRETISSSFTPALFVMKKQLGTNFAVGLCLAVTLVVSISTYLSRKSRSNYHGSVADLVKRGQLRSDRRGISRPLKYDDPFNNPLVKVSKSNSTVEMCGKVYRLAPVTLTDTEQSNHQKRRSRAYQWKRPTMFLKEGDSIPPDVDPDTVRWIPANHPFATTVNDIDEDLAQSNVYQKRGVPFRIKAEHEALQRKLETLQSEQKLVIEPGNVRDFERPFKSSPHEHVEQKPSANESCNSSTPTQDRGANSSETKISFDELQKP